MFWKSGEDGSWNIIYEWSAALCDKILSYLILSVCSDV
jgi:hypothetical protein